MSVRFKTKSSSNALPDLHGSLLMKESETHMSARLRDFVVINVDPKAVHNKASQLSIDSFIVIL